MIVVERPEDLTGRAGQHLGWSEWHTIGQAEIDHFAEATGNRAPIHTDPEFASRTPYGGTIVFGIQVLTMATMLLGDVGTCVDRRCRRRLDKVRHLSRRCWPGHTCASARRVRRPRWSTTGVRTTLDLTFEGRGPRPGPPASPRSSSSFVLSPSPGVRLTVSGTHGPSVLTYWC